MLKIIKETNLYLQIFVKLNTSLMNKGIFCAGREYSFGRQMQCIIRNVFEMSVQSLKIPISEDKQQILLNGFHNVISKCERNCSKFVTIQSKCPQI